MDLEIDKEFEKVTVNIIGSCVSREPFNYLPCRYNLEIKEFVHKISPLYIDSAEGWPILVENEVNFKHNFNKRCTCTLFNGTTKERLLNNKGDWVILDDYYFSLQLFEITNKDGNKRVIQVPLEMHDEIKRIVETNPKYQGFSIRKLDALPNYSLLVPKLVSFLKNNWGSNIIIIESAYSRKLITDNILKGDLNVKEAEVYNRKIATKKLLDSLDCYYIPLSSELLSRDSKTSVHYGYEVYEYVANVIGQIIQKPKDWELNCQRFLIDLQLKQSAILYHNAYPISMLENRIHDIIAKKTYDDFEQCLNSLIENKDLSSTGIAEKLISDIYKHKHYAKISYDKALYWIHKALEKGGYYYPELYELLGKRGRPEDYSEIFLIATKCSELNDKESMGWLGRLYRDGMGVEKDLRKAAEWMRKAADSRVQWPKYEYFDILWMINDEDSLKSMIKFAKKESSKGNMELRARLGRAYRDGMGVEKDLRKAANIMKETLSGKPDWSKWEYLDILWDMNTIETDQEMFEYANRVKNGKYGEIWGRLGRMYRDGRGVEVNYTLAEEWMRKAAENKVKWAKKELQDIIAIKDKKDTV